MNWKRGDIGKAISPETGYWVKVKIKKKAYYNRCDGIKCNNQIVEGELHGAGQYFYTHFCLDCVCPLE